MNPILENKPKILSRLGTLWHRQSSRASEYGLKLIRTMARLIDLVNADSKVQESAGLLLGTRPITHRNSVKLSLVGTSITPIAGNTGYVYLDSDGQLRTKQDDLKVPAFDFTSGITPHYVVKIPPDLAPISIASNLGFLTVGNSFENSPGLIRFYESPHSLFTNGEMFIIAAATKQDNIHNYTLQVDDYKGTGYYIARYHRESQSVHSLELALNDLIGRAILPADGVLVDIQVIEDKNKRVYVFDNGISLAVDYNHVPLTLGNYYEKETVIGKAIHLFTPPDGATSSWVESKFATGAFLDLKELNTNYPAVKIPNSVVRFWAYDSSEV